jgi:hypothetical protein
VVSGKELVAGDGKREMPIFSLELAHPDEAESGAGGPGRRNEGRINQEINLIVSYVESIQEN